MAKDLEKLIDTIDLPEMEYVAPPKHKTISYEVPEIVLPKTKAQEFAEAKGRLSQKTIPVSRTITRDNRARPHRTTDAPKTPADVKTVELDAAAAAAVGSASIARRTREKRNVDALKVLIEHMKPLAQPKWVGSADELVPFAWNHPLVDVPKPTKYYKNSVRTVRDAALMLPVPRER